MEKTYQLVVFDWDGTLVDSEQKIVRCFQQAASDVGVQIPQANAIKRMIGLSLSTAFDQLINPLTADQRDALCHRYRCHFVELDKTEMSFFPNVLAGLDRLTESGYLLGVATGKARRGLQKLLDEHNLHHKFAATRCADEAFSKPHPQMLLDVLLATGMSASSALMVGDTTYDMEMAQNAGVDAIGVSYGAHPQVELEVAGALQCMHSFDEVVDWLI